MNGTIFASAFYTIGLLICCSGFFLWKKTKSPQLIVLWLPLTGILAECYMTFIAAVLCLIKIPTNLFTLGIFLYAAGVFFWIRIIRKKEKQEYLRISIYDIVFVVLLVGVVLYIAHIRYGLPSLDWSYATVDPSARYREAMEFVNDEYVRHMFFAQLQNGTLIELVSPVANYDYYYRIYVLGDILQLLLNAFMFYGIARRFALRGAFAKEGKTPHFGNVVAIIAGIFYTLGYPLNSMIWGFTYLGMSLYLIMALLVITDDYVQKEYTGKIFPIILLMLGCTAIFQCYVLFMPVTYLAVALPILVSQAKEKRLFSWNTLVKGLGIFLLPVLFGFIYTYMEVFVQDDIKVASAASAEGAIYRDLYSNFLFFGPLALIGIILLIKKKKNSFLTWFAPMFGGMMLFMFIVSYTTRKISTYYFFKDHYLLWLVTFLLLVYALNQVSTQGRVMAGLYMGSWAFVAVLFFFGIENRIEARNQQFVRDNKSMYYNDLLAFNWNTIWSPRYRGDKMDLTHHVYDLLQSGEAEGPVAIVSIQEETYLYESMTGQMLTDFEWWKELTMDEYYQNILDLCDYVCVYNDCEQYLDRQEMFDQMEIIYENTAGFIAKVN